MSVLTSFFFFFELRDCFCDRDRFFNMSGSSFSWLPQRFNATLLEFARQSQLDESGCFSDATSADASFSPQRVASSNPCIWDGKKESTASSCDIALPLPQIPTVAQVAAADTTTTAEGSPDASAQYSCLVKVYVGQKAFNASQHSLSEGRLWQPCYLVVSANNFRFNNQCVSMEAVDEVVQHTLHVSAAGPVLFQIHTSSPLLPTRAQSDECDGADGAAVYTFVASSALEMKQCCDAIQKGAARGIPCREQTNWSTAMSSFRFPHN